MFGGRTVCSEVVTLRYFVVMESEKKQEITHNNT